MFGICLAPEHFQHRMPGILKSLSGVMSNMGDVIIFGETQEQHDECLIEVLHRLAQARVTLNEKCEFSKCSLKYLGHVIFFEGIKADPGKSQPSRI